MFKSEWRAFWSFEDDFFLFRVGVIDRWEMAGVGGPGRVNSRDLRLRIALGLPGTHAGCTVPSGL